MMGTGWYCMIAVIVEVEMSVWRELGNNKSGIVNIE